jgi:hypothetical protein
MIGAVGKSENGLIGVICHVNLTKNASDEKTLRYSGVTLDGKSWHSNNPVLLAKSINEYIVKFIIPKCHHDEEWVELMSSPPLI